MVNRCFKRIIEELDNTLSNECLEFKYRQTSQGYSRLKNSQVLCTCGTGLYTVGIMGLLLKVSTGCVSCTVAIISLYKPKASLSRNMGRE